MAAESAFSEPGGPPATAASAGASLPPCGALEITLREVATRAFWSQRRHIEVTVEGTSRPVEVVIRNVTPESLRLEGGPEQRVTTSGGSPNRARLRAVVTAMYGRVTADPICDDSIPGADQLSRQVEQAVETIEPELKRQVTALAGSLSTRDALDLLNRLERRLLAALDGPGHAPLRAWIEDWFDGERAFWREAASVTGSWLRSSAIVFAAAGQPPGPRAEPCGAACFLARVSALFDTLRAVASDLTIDLCVRSTPARADVSIHPKRYPQGREETTDTDFRNLTRGIWVVTVTWKGATAPFEIDLISDARNVLDCSRNRERCHREARPARFVCDRRQRD